MGYTLSDLMHMKDWKLRKVLRDTRRAAQYNEQKPNGLQRLMRQHYEVEIPRLEREVERRKQERKSKT